MSEPFLAEIKIFAGSFAPFQYAFCSGQLIAIQQNTALFSLIGTYYGGNGTSNFQLPNLQGRAPIGMGQGPGLSNYVIGQTGGEMQHTLLQTELPNHGHTFNAAAGGRSNNNTVTNESPANTGSTVHVYSTTANATMSPAMLQSSGTNLPHDNIQPCLAVSFIIALAGVYPARS